MTAGRDWVRYWRDPGRPLEAMAAHFERHVYHRHSHDAYSFGVTEEGAQAFSCRGAAHTSAAGMVMAFNPDDPHDGRAADALGFTYRIVHIGPDLIRALLADVTGGAAALPLFARPVVHDPVLARALRRLHSALLGGADTLRRDEELAAAVAAMVRRSATRGLSAPSPAADADRTAAQVRELLHERMPADITLDELAKGRSRFAVYRDFRARYGMAPSDYLRQLRLRAARALLAAGVPPAEAAGRVGFADQSHLTRWFGRYYGITPAGYARGRASVASPR
ncbi:AraC family transcriptional regulator [Allonocardiopsis opalescens]|uniref:AraC-like DNA-binding protein n=1 Tax=Allonocardiopsis opalescens TaxID=1144618 RepID=A0A2T0PU26_9ACTN|nr:AraC family transcriptional regulator [Allonocardiopsis opalescens]PRX92405.1 AraC-like DNA-binding protein [Allonocardiopsis opalescens]